MRPRASLVTQTVKNLPAIWETRVQSLSQEDPLGKGLAEQLTLSLSRGLINSVPQILTTDSNVHVVYLLLPKRFKKKPTSVCES